MRHIVWSSTLLAATAMAAATVTGCGPAFTGGELTIQPGEDDGAVDNVTVDGGSVTDDADPSVARGSDADTDVITHDAQVDDVRDAEVRKDPLPTEASAPPPPPLEGGPMEAAAPPIEAGPTCSTLGSLPECDAWANGAIEYFSGGVFYDINLIVASTNYNSCVSQHTPPECQCAETYTCECIERYAPCASIGSYTFTSCTVQADGVPLVVCK
jgi:hypothetical protein